MVTAKEVLQEFNPTFGIKAPAKPPKMKKFNVFYWHRRYPTHKFLKPTASIWDKCRNGDFEYSPYGKYINYEYWWMAEEIAVVRNSDHSHDTKQEKERDIRRSYNKRLKNLRQDFQRDEAERLLNLKESLRKTFGGSKAYVDEFINDYACGTTDEVIKYYPYWLRTVKEDNSPF